MVRSGSVVSVGGACQEASSPDGHCLGETIKHPVSPAGEQVLSPKVEQAHTADTQRWSTVFRRVQRNGKVRPSSLPWALQLAGLLHWHTEAEERRWREEAFAEVTENGMRSLTLDRFVCFLEAFEARELAAITRLFRLYDFNSSGTIDATEFPSVLRALGITPLDQVIQEIMSEVVPAGVSEIPREGFRLAMKIIRSRQGFSHREVDRFAAAFDRFDFDGSGMVDREALSDTLDWLGFSLREKEVEELLKMTTANSDDGRNVFDKFDFLVFMRKVREHEIEKIRYLLQRLGRDLSGTITRSEELEELLYLLGYFPEPDAIREVAEDCNLTRRVATQRGKPRFQQFTTRGMGLSELMHYLQVFRNREGFTRCDLEEIEKAFRRYDHDSTGQIQIAEVGKVLRWLGYPSSGDLQEYLVEKADSDNSGGLDLIEIRKLVRLYFEREVQKMKAVFEEYDTKGIGLLYPLQCELALSSLSYDTGCPTARTANQPARAESKQSTMHHGQDRLQLRRLSEEDVLNATRAIVEHHESGNGRRLSSQEVSERSHPDGWIDVRSFVQRGLELYRQARLLFRHNAGYSKQELEEMRGYFDRYDLDGSGFLDHDELRKLLQELFPRLTSARMRPLLVKVLSEVYTDSTGSLDFSDFLRLMRQCKGLVDQDKAAKETAAIKESGFSSSEVLEFRELFELKSGVEYYQNQNANEDVDQSYGQYFLSLAGFRAMIEQSCPLEKGDVRVLRKLLYAIQRDMEIHEAGRRESLADKSGKGRTSLRRSSRSPSRSPSSSPRARGKLGFMMDSQHGDSGHLDMMDFPEYLLLMHRVLNDNIANIKGRCDQSALVQKKKAQQRKAIADDDDHAVVKEATKKFSADTAVSRWKTHRPTALRHGSG
jgi:Ca2+-binding EF-hand superfamily protein